MAETLMAVYIHTHSNLIKNYKDIANYVLEIIYINDG